MKVVLAALVLTAFTGSLFAAQKIKRVHQPRQHVRVINPIKPGRRGHIKWN